MKKKIRQTGPPPNFERHPWYTNQYNQGYEKTSRFQENAAPAICAASGTAIH